MQNIFVTIPDLYTIYLQYPSVVTDTRKIQKGDIFFALKGSNFNGNNFAFQALNAGAFYAVVDEEIENADSRFIRVDDVLTTLQNLAKYHREQFKVPFIAITGSNGKTTTKELVHAVLSAHFINYTTEGNLNNHIGIPLTLLRVKRDAQMAVIEMGANHQKEIEGYCLYTQPTHGIITNCGKAHLEGFGGVEGVKKGKGELFDYLRLHHGAAFVYDEYGYLQSMSMGIETIILYGTENGIVTGHIIKSEPFLLVALTNGTSFSLLQTQLVGDYNLPNVLCAVAIGKYFGVPDKKIKQAIENYVPSNSRSQLIERGTNKIILDAYNANPSSMKVAIENFARIYAGDKILLLGGMMELGEESYQEHKAILQLIDIYQWKKVVLVGGDFKEVHGNYTYFNNASEAALWFGQQHFENAYILIKGSRSMQMERILG